MNYDTFNNYSATGLSKAELVFTRENLFYHKNKATWLRALQAYNGGREYIDLVLTKHPAETDEEFEARRRSAYHLNLVKYSVRSFGDYIFGKEPRRMFPGSTEDPLVEDFDRQKQHANIVMRKMFDFYTLCNLTWAFVSMPNIAGTRVTEQMMVAGGIRPHVVTLSPLAVPDWCFDSNGELEWVIVEEVVADKTNPLKPPVIWKMRHLITKTFHQTYKAILTSPYNYSPDPGIIVGKAYTNTIGKVPVIPFSDILYDKDFNTPAIADVLTISEAVMMGESELLTNILKQTYGQLVLPMSMSAMKSRIIAKIAKDMGPEFDRCSTQVDRLVQQEVSVAVGRSKALWEDTDEVGITRYVQPDGANITSIITHNDRLINITTRLIGLMTGVQTTQRASADSKAMDNAGFSAQLNNIASRLQEFEGNIWKLFKQYVPRTNIPKIEYNKNFNVHDFRAVIAGIVELANINGGQEYVKQVKRVAASTLDNIVRMSDTTYNTIRNEIEDGKEADKPPKFEEKADHVTEASGSRPDSVEATPHYRKSTESISKTAGI